MLTTNIAHRIDLNADLGEGSAYDAQMLALVSSANIACGGHTGDAHSMRAALLLAKAHGVALGAHPSFPDRENFGRRPMQIAPEDLYASLLQQVRALQNTAEELGLRLHHIKPHGALYNQAAFDPGLGDLIIDLVKTIDPDLRLMVLAASPLAKQAKSAGLHVIEEAFADRRYLGDGSLVPRTQANAVIEDAELAVAQSLAIVNAHCVQTLSGETRPLYADSLCVHGDGSQALHLLQTIRQALVAQGWEIASD